MGNVPSGAVLDGCFCGFLSVEEAAGTVVSADTDFFLRLRVRFFLAGVGFDDDEGA